MHVCIHYSHLDLGSLYTAAAAHVILYYTLRRPRRGFKFWIKFRVHAVALCTYIYIAAQKVIKVETTSTYTYIYNIGTTSVVFVQCEEWEGVSETKAEGNKN